MNDTNAFDKAMELAIIAHSGQTDRGGYPFIMHPLRVMHNMETMEEKIVALLHDTVEDSPMTLAQLSTHGFSSSVVEAVDNLTRRKGENYLNEYINRVYQMELSRWVKVKDLEDNMQMVRLRTVSEKDLERVRKYKIAWDLLKGV